MCARVMNLSRAAQCDRRAGSAFSEYDSKQLESFEDINAAFRRCVPFGRYRVMLLPLC